MSKSQWAYRTVRAMILSGDLPPGFAVDQQALAAELGISTTPLREALRRLEAEDYVISHDHREMHIAPMSVDDVEQIYAVRLVLYPMAARLACQNVTAAEVRAIQSLLSSEQEKTKNYDPMVANREFHRAIYAASGNQALARVLEALWDRCDRYRAGMQDDPDLSRDARLEHMKMCDCLIERDGEGLAALLRVHLEESLDHIRRHLAEQPAVAS